MDDDDDKTTSMTVKDTTELLKSVHNILPVQVPMGVHITLANILKEVGVDKETYTHALGVLQKGAEYYFEM